MERIAASGVPVPGSTDVPSVMLAEVTPATGVGFVGGALCIVPHGLGSRGLDFLSDIAARDGQSAMMGVDAKHRVGKGL